MEIDLRQSSQKKMMKSKLETFYVRFYKTGELRKVEAPSEEEAYRLAVEKFGDSGGVWTIGKLLRNGDQKPANGILLKR